jgi:hypothetical protein
MKKFFKILGIIAAVIIVISIIGGLMDKGDSKTGSTAGNTEAKEEAAPAKPKIEILSFSQKMDEFASHVYAEVKNNSTKKAAYIDFKVYYYDENGGIVGSGIGNMTTRARTNKNSECLSMDNLDNAKKYKVKSVTLCGIKIFVT